MEIRAYQPGDEAAQVAIYNAAAKALPAFKPATVEEVTRRYRNPNGDPCFRLYAVKDGQVVGYAVANSNGRISYPWCLPEWQNARELLLESLLELLHEAGWADAYACYRADWGEVLDYLGKQGFERQREVVNYLAPMARITSALGGQPRLYTSPIQPQDVPLLTEMGREAIATWDPDVLSDFYLRNPYFQPEDVFVAQKEEGDGVVGFGLAIMNDGYADPTQINPQMPCFRLGAFGTEAERHKRVRGMVSILLRDLRHAEAVLAEAVRRVAAQEIAYVATQAATDQPQLLALYDRYFDRQGSFPVMVREL